MKQRFLVCGFVFFGMCLLALGLGWNQFVPTTIYWTPEKAEEFSAAQTELHAQWHNQKDARYAEQAEAAKARFLRIRDELESARISRSHFKTAFLAGGVLSLLVGISIHLAGGQNE